MKIGILGAGKIADKVTNTLEAMEEIQCYAVASRNLDNAKAFAQRHGFAVAYGSYEEMLQDDNVELVYICTPHSHHFEHMMRCIKHGKNILCEKAFTRNAEEARSVMNAAREAGVFVAEAIWTRYMPSRHVIQSVLESGIIGKPNTLTANLSYVISEVPRIRLPELAGGALLDIGVYGINFAFMHFGTDILRVETAVSKLDTGVDGMEVITIFYRDGRMAVLTHSVFCRSDRKGIIHGDKGYMVVENINDPQSLTVYDTEDRQIAYYDFSDQISGYEFQFRECRERIRKGEKESVSMPMEDTVAVMEFMDSLRKSWNVVYPGEE